MDLKLETVVIGAIVLFVVNRIFQVIHKNGVDTVWDTHIIVCFPLANKQWAVGPQIVKCIANLIIGQMVVDIMLQD